jgi:hypothetical protein
MIVSCAAAAPVRRFNSIVIRPKIDDPGCIEPAQDERGLFENPWRVEE